MKIVCVYAARASSHHPTVGTYAHQAVITPSHQSMLQLPPSFPLSTSCPQHLDSRHLDQSLDSLQLTQMEIDAIRSMGRGSRASSPSTPTSQLSHPDFEDPRPDIYRFVYDISPGTRSRTSDSASVSAEGGDFQSPELQQESRFDEIIIASMAHPASHRAEHRHKVKTVTLCESEGAAEHSESESLPTFDQSAARVHAASEPETHLTVTSAPTAVQSSDLMVVSVGDALVAVQQGSELMPSKDNNEVQQLPVTAASAGPARQLLDSTSSRIHKGCYISVQKSLILYFFPI